MAQRQVHPTSHLFMLRMWVENSGEGTREWRGQVEYVTSGERHYFREWPALVEFLESTLTELEDGSPMAAHPDRT